MFRIGTDVLTYFDFVYGSSQGTNKKHLKHLANVLQSFELTYET